MQQMTAGAASQSKEMFEINKALSLANAAIMLPEAVMGAYKVGASMGGPVLGAAYGALAFGAQMSQISSIQSSSFGGGGGATSMPTSGGGFVTTPGVAPSDIGGATEDDEPTVKEITINLGDSAMVSTEAIRALFDQVNEEIGDGMVIRT
jgi:hypothetical protein